MVVGGADISSRYLDIVLLDDEPECLWPVRWHRFELRGQDAFDRARDVVNAIPERWWINQHVSALGIEDPRGINPGPIFRVQGALLATIPAHVAVTPWIPGQWRKAVGLPGNASKADVMFEVAGLTDLNAFEWPQDAADAYCIALATRARVTTEKAA